MAIIIINEIKTKLLKFQRSHCDHFNGLKILQEKPKLRLCERDQCLFFNLDSVHSVSAFKFKFGLKMTFSSKSSFFKISTNKFFEIMFDLICSNFFDLKRVITRPGNFWLETARNTLFGSFERLCFFFLFWYHRIGKILNFSAAFASLFLLFCPAIQMLCNNSMLKFFSE